MLLQDAGILRQMAEAQNAHQHIIYTLQDELTYLSDKYGQDSFAYRKNAQRLRLITKLFRQYEEIFHAYSDGFAHLEVSNYLLNLILESYKNGADQNTGKTKVSPKKGAIKDIIEKAQAFSPKRHTRHH